MRNATLAMMRNSLLASILALAVMAHPAFAKNDNNTSKVPTSSAPTSFAPAAEGDAMMGGSSNNANAVANSGAAPTSDISPDAMPPPAADMAPAPKMMMSAAGESSAAPANILQPPPGMPIRNGDNAVQGLGDMGGPSPSMAMANASEAADPMSAFGPSSGTVVGNRALELRDEVLRLRASVNLNTNEFMIQRSSGASGAVQYHSTVAAITARLQNGTTHGNPILLRQWDEADQALNEVSGSMGRLNSLQTSVDADASLASYLLGSVQAAFDLSGAVDEDLDQLKLLRDEVSRLVVQLDYLRNQITNDIERQTAYLTSERTNLQALAFAISRGELIGNSLANRPVIVNPVPVSMMPAAMTSMAPAAPAMAPPMSMGMQPGIAGPAPMSPSTYMQETGQMTPTPPPATGVATNNPDAGLAPTIGHLLVLIRYNQPVVDYEAQLSKAVGDALERRPNAQFAVVAVTPSSGDPADLAKAKENAQRDADAVKRSLVQLGLSPSRISMANTQTQNANTPEVHVYIR